MTSLAPPSSAPAGTATGAKPGYPFALTVLTSLFFMWGFITCLNDILIPHLKALFTLNYTRVMLIQFSFFTAYAVASLPSGMLVGKVGYKNGIVIGLVTAGIGCLLFHPAAGFQSYPMFLGALFILAVGITLLQVAANPYVAILGPPGTASSRLILTQAFNSLGTTIAPVFGSMLILSATAKSAGGLKALGAAQGTARRLAQAGAVQTPYLGLALALFLIAAIFAIIRLPRIGAGDARSGGAGEDAFSHPQKSAWAHRHLVLGAVAIFVYVGGEVAIGSFLINYFGQPEIGGLAPETAGKWVSFYWGGAMVGRFAGSFFTRMIPPNRCLAFNAFAAGTLVVVSMLTGGHLAMGAILLVGLFNSIMFPTIFTLAISGLGKRTGQGSGILCTAIVGGALIPVLQGALADRIGIHHAFILPVACYLYVAYYGLKGWVPAVAGGDRP